MDFELEILLHVRMRRVHEYSSEFEETELLNEYFTMNSHSWKSSELPTGRLDLRISHEDPHSENVLN